MNVYTTRADWMDAAPVLAGQTVIDQPDEPRDTGLVNAAGEKLYRVTQRRPIGFMARIDD